MELHINKISKSYGSLTILHDPAPGYMLLSYEPFRLRKDYPSEDSHGVRAS